jgi:hypothetical protein
MCHLLHKLIGFYNREEKCLQRGTNWGFKFSGLRFVFKGLMKFRCIPRIFDKHLNITFHENASTGSGVVPCRQTDGHEADSRLSQFCEPAR